MANIYLNNQPAGTYGGVSWGTGSDSNDGLSPSSPKLTANTAFQLYILGAQDNNTLFINDGDYVFNASDGRLILSHTSSNIQPSTPYGTTVTFSGSNTQGLRYNYSSSESRTNTIGKIIIKTSHQKHYGIYTSGSNINLQTSVMNCEARIVPTNDNLANTATRYAYYDAGGSCEVNITGGGVSAADGTLIDISGEAYEYRPYFRPSSLNYNTSIPTKVNITSWAFNLKARLTNGRGAIDIVTTNQYPSGSSFNIQGVSGTIIGSNTNASLLWFIKLVNQPNGTTVHNNTVNFSALNGSGAGGIWLLGKEYDSLNNEVNDNDITLTTDSGTGFGILLGAEGVASDYSVTSGDIFDNTLTGANSSTTNVNALHGLNHIHAEGERYNNTVTGVAIGSLTKASGSTSRNNTITIDPASNSKTHLYAKGAYAGASFSNETLVSTSTFQGNFMQSLKDDTTGGADVFSSNVSFTDINITGDLNTNAILFSVGYLSGDDSTAVITNVTLPEDAPTLNTYGRSSLVNYNSITDVNTLSWVTGVSIDTGMTFNHNKAVAFYSFEDGSSIGKDVSGSSRDAAVTNVTTSGITGAKFAEFNGTDSRLDLTSHLGEFTPLTSMGFAANIKLNNTSGVQTLFSISDSTVGSSNLSLFVLNGTLFLQARLNNSGLFTSSAASLSAGTLTAGVEYHIAFSIGANGTTIWVDGVSKNTDAVVITPASISNADSILLGANKDSNGFEWELDGALKDVYISNVGINGNTVSNMINNDTYGFVEIGLLGQSNMVGRADIRVGIDDNYSTVNGKVFQFGHGNQTLTNAVNPLDHNQSETGTKADNMGLWLTLCNELVGILPYKRKILLIPVATGSTGFVNSGANPAGWVSPSGAQYADAVSRMVSARSQSTLSNLDLVCWWQGEYDAGNGGVASYETNLSTMVSAFIAEGSLDWTAQTPFVSFGIGTLINSTNSAAVNTALSSYAGTSADRHFIDTSSLGLSTDNVHYTAASYAAAGVLVAEQVYGLTVVPVLDTDGDGVVDSNDAFPNDPNETLDSDNDTVGDNADAFPYDPNETLDSDNDGVGDNADAFPNDPDETVDSDGDGIGDNSDPFFNLNIGRAFALAQVDTGQFYTKAQTDAAIAAAIASITP